MVKDQEGNSPMGNYVSATFTVDSDYNQATIVTIPIETNQSSPFVVVGYDNVTKPVRYLLTIDPNEPSLTFRSGSSSQALMNLRNMRLSISTGLKNNSFMTTSLLPIEERFSYGSTYDSLQWT